MHGDTKVVQQLLMNDGHVSKDGLAQDGSSLLGKYIIGAKNNFRGFNSGPENKSSSVQVTVHHRDEGVDEESSDSKLESDAQENQEDQCGSDELMKVTDCELVTMEEGRAKLEMESKDRETDADKNEQSDDTTKEEEVEEVNTQGTNQREHVVTDTIAEQNEFIAISNEKIDTKKLVKKFEDIELQEKDVEGRWRKFGNNIAQHEVMEKHGASPTGSSSSQDTGFGSREGEGSIDGMARETGHFHTEPSVTSLNEQ